MYRRMELVKFGGVDTTGKAFDEEALSSMITEWRARPKAQEPVKLYMQYGLPRRTAIGEIRNLEVENGAVLALFEMTDSEATPIAEAGILSNNLSLAAKFEPAEPYRLVEASLIEDKVV